MRPEGFKNWILQVDKRKCWSEKSNPATSTMLTSLTFHPNRPKCLLSLSFHEHTDPFTWFHNNEKCCMFLELGSHIYHLKFSRWRKLSFQLEHWIYSFFFFFHCLVWFSSKDIGNVLFLKQCWLWVFLTWSRFSLCRQKVWNESVCKMMLTRKVSIIWISLTIT